MATRFILRTGVLSALLLLAACGGPTADPPTSEAQISIEPTGVTLEPNQPQEFTATVTGADNTSVIWSTDGGSIEAEGAAVTYTAPQEEGAFTITATSGADPTASATAAVTVSAALPPTDDLHSVAAGWGHSLALKSDGTVWAWGVGGVLGDGSGISRNTPVQAHDLTDVVSIAAGGHHSLALKSDGTVWAWGHNSNGQLGDGTTTERSTPAQVQDLTGMVGIAAGVVQSFAVKSDGTVWAWGHNSNGQLGDGTTTERSTPVQVIGLP